MKGAVYMHSSLLFPVHDNTHCHHRLTASTSLCVP